MVDDCIYNIMIMFLIKDKPLFNIYEIIILIIIYIWNNNKNHNIHNIKYWLKTISQDFITLSIFCFFIY